MLTLAPSDIMLAVDLALAVVFALYFSLGKPRVWFRDRLGWVIFGYAIAVIALLGLIVYALLTGERVEEPARFVVGGGLGAALVAKTWSVYQERHEGRLSGARQDTIERNGPMSSLTPSSEALKKATTIWYRGQRVLRTAFTTILTVLPLVPQVIAILQGQWDAAWLTPVAVQAVAINAALTAIIGLPTVNAWLTKFGLGSVPRGAVYVSPTTGTVQVKADTKADGHGR